nr:hypothetical protein CFP56_75732 [Quercus suber]POF21741.1 hypothetical protein CFP56_79279 [Quercus suber]
MSSTDQVPHGSGWNIQRSASNRNRAIQQASRDESKQRSARVTTLKNKSSSKGTHCTVHQSMIQKSRTDEAHRQERESHVKLSRRGFGKQPVRTRLGFHMLWLNHARLRSLATTTCGSFRKSWSVDSDAFIQPGKSPISVRH